LKTLEGIERVGAKNGRQNIVLSIRSKFQ